MKKVTEALAEYRYWKRVLEEETERLEENRKRQEALKEAQQILQVLSQQVQQEAHERIASVVTRCLHAVFDDPYDFKITFERKRGRTEAVMSFVRNGLEIDPATAAGGGVVDVAAYALRLACVVLSRDVRKLLILDEPFKMLSANYSERVAALIETMAKEMKVQHIMVTHNPDLKIGKVIEIGG